MIAALELLAMLVGVRLWVLEGKSKQTTRATRITNPMSPIDFDLDGVNRGANC